MRPHHPILTIPTLALLFGALVAPVGADEVPVLVPTAIARAVALDEDSPMQVFAVTVPQGARRLHAVAAAPYDVDLYVHGSALEDGALEQARITSTLMSMVEVVALQPATGEQFAAPETFYVHVKNPHPETRDLAVSLTAWAEIDAPVLPPNRSLDVTIPAGTETLSVDLPLPRGLGAARVRAETTRGVPALRGVLGEVAVPSLPSGGGALLILADLPEVMPGAWRLEVGRPGGLPIEEACPVRLEASVVPRSPQDGAWTEHDALPLVGPSGERTIELSDSGWRDLLLDVRRPVRSVRIEASLEGGDVDLYATRSRPVDLSEDGNWHYGSWLDGESEVLLLGGTGALPAGRYWLAVKRVGGSGKSAHVTWEGRNRPLHDEELPPSRGTLDVAARGIELGANEQAVWWDLPPGLRRDAHVRALGADKDVDLLLSRADTGAVVLRGISPLHAEQLQIPTDLVVPERVGLRLGLCRWNVTHPVQAGDLHVSRRAPPEPPADYFPPYAAFARDARGRTLAAAVHLETEENKGSGVVVAPSGLFLTCHHMIEDLSADAAIHVSFPTRTRGRPRQLYLARVVASDEALDLALLELSRDVFGRPVPTARRHPFVPLGDSTALQLEEPLRIVGYGRAGSSSFISNLCVVPGALVGVEVEGEQEVWLLNDARLGPGSSGAGTFDAAGRLVGVHWGSYGEEGSSLSYAAPVSTIPADWLERIRKEGGQTPGR